MTISSNLITSFEPLLAEGQIVLIGEWHGTNEFPDLVGQLATRACERGLSVTVALEVACSEQDSLSAFVAGSSNIDTLTGPWWQRGPEFQDGRSSQAMARLVTTAATLVGLGNDVVVAAVDSPWVAPGSPIDPERLHLIELPRDQVMATYLLEVIDNRPKAVTIFLAGSAHTRVRPITKNEQPTGRYIHMWHPRTVSLLGRSSGGMAWTLSGDMGRGREQSVPDDAALDAEAVWSRDPGRDGHHGYVHVGRVTSSRPFHDNRE